MARLSSASKKAANNVASKLNSNTASSVKPSDSATQASAIAKAQMSVVVPGLMEFTPDNIQGMLPQFDESKYQVGDPLNPSADMPQVSQQQFDRSEAIYQGGIRLPGWNQSY